MKILKNNIKWIIALSFAIILCLGMTVTVSAAELSTKTISEANAEDVTIQPRGSLSGYGHEWHGGGSGIDYFDFTVSGSWSPWAGCTVKTEGFPSSASTAYRLVRLDGGSEIAMFPDNADRWLNGNNEDKNIPLFNVSPGTYRLYYQCYFGDSGTVHCWVY